ncbi:MAG: hypothetical protein HKN32_02370 [Flavobacteriales bacterium]|nr:hypothetical protein [Flavobacteriales bacterium]
MKTILTTLCVCLLLSCQIDPCGSSPEAFVDKYEQFIDDLDEKELAFDDKSWEDHDRKFKKYVKECYPNYEDDLSRKEERRFAQSTAKYYLIKYGKGLQYQYNHDPEEFSRIVGDNVESIVDAYGDEFEEMFESFMEENGDNLEQLAEDIGDAVERFVENIDEEQIQKSVDWLEEIVNNIEVEISHDKKKN